MPVAQAQDLADNAELDLVEIAPAASPRAHRNAGTVQDGRHLKPAMIATPLTETAARLHAAWSADTLAVEAVRPHAILVSLLGAATG